MKLLTTTAAIALLSTGTAFADAHASTMGYALAEDGATLVVMPSIAAPGDLMTYALETPLQGIAYRPVTGDLLGFTNGMIVTIDPMTGMQTDLGATFMDDAMIADGSMVAFDFNNAIDAVRAVGSDGANLVYFPEGFGDNDERAGSVRRFTDIAFGEGDPNAGMTPMIFANAYTNAINGATASGTAQYAFDAETNTLVTLANNDGTLATVGIANIDGTPVDLAPMGGFDIVSAEEGSDAAYAILQIEGEDTASLYAVDLSSGTLTPLADLGMGGFTGFAASMGM